MEDFAIYMKNKDPSIGYSIAYPFGVIGPILCIYFMTQMVKPKFPAKAQRFHMGEISIGEKVSGQTLDEIEKKLPSGVQVTMVRRGGQNVVPSGDIALSSGDALLVVAEQQEAIAEAAAQLGKLAPGRLAKDRGDLDYIRVFVGKANVVGVPLSQLPMPAGFPAHLLHVRRYDADLVPTPDLMLEFGDRVGVLMPPDRKEDIRKHFGDTVKAAAEFSYVSLGLGMVLGVLLGLIPIPIPGVGTVTLGIGGGPLIVALILGKLRRTGPMLWTMFLAAIVVAGFLFSPAPRIAETIKKFSHRLNPDRGEEFVEQAGATIRAVSRGVIGISVLQALLAGIGLMVAGIPQASLITFGVLVFGIIQIGPSIILIPVVIWAWTFMIAQPAWQLPITQGLPFASGCAAATFSMKIASARAMS